MTLDELKNRLVASGLTPICVVNEPPRDDDRLRINGGLAEYMEAARAVSAKTVVIYSRVFAEDHFLYFPGRDDGDPEESQELEVEPVDLRVANEALKKYKQFNGQPAVFHLSTQAHAGYLDLVLEENWWREFLEERFRTTDELEHAHEQKSAAEEAKEEAETERLIVQLHELADDPKFAKLPTQKAMVQYALRQIPTLSSIEPSDLKSEIQEIKAKIDAAL